MEKIVPDMANVDALPETESMLPAELVCDESFLQSLDERLKRGLETMSRRYRDAFLLSTIGNMSCPEVARKLKIPVGTVMSRLHRAKAALREAYLQSA
jgi:RNA polymerase sigma-70 factor (ECF subfamily)